MKFTMNTYDFKNAIEKAYKAIDKNAPISVLVNVKLHIEGENSYILGTNLENFVKANIDVQGTDKIMDIVFSDTATLLKAIKFFNDGNIMFLLENDNITLTCGGKTTTQWLLNEDGVIAVPDVNTENAKHYKYDIASLKGRFNLIKYAAGKDENRPIFTGVHFNANDMVALDGYRAALNKSEDLTIETAFTIPVNSLALAIDVLNKDITIIVNDKLMQISDGNTTVTSRLLSGEYLDYDSVITNDGNAINVNITEYKDTLKYFKAFKKSGQAKDKRQKAAWFNNKLLFDGY